MRYGKLNESFNNDYETSKCRMMTWNAMIGKTPPQPPETHPFLRELTKGW
jgi:hypothetical protein